ncbi:WbqC family protein [Nonomuraea sp. NPDC047897]|uniref:WbqC family protein n=1 Tax=Nonomuraea sp. NPDC047897 TaxID=3364346 RepID=UPI00371BC938
MTPTSLFCAPDSTAGSLTSDRPAPARVCAIHQPNLFPRLATLAKIVAADYWIVLDDVQFARRDYQHRARLSATPGPGAARWLSIATRLPHGRSTPIREARLADPIRCRRRLPQLLADCYRRSPYWPEFRRSLNSVLDLFDITDRLAVVTEASTRLLLNAVGWSGQILHSSVLPARAERSERLADLAGLTGATVYLCGTGGLTYLSPDPFRTYSVRIIPFQMPEMGIWATGRQVSALDALMLIGPNALSLELRKVRDAIPDETPPGKARPAVLGYQELLELPKPSTPGA